jgi:hypothetical protein
MQLNDWKKTQLRSWYTKIKKYNIDINNLSMSLVQHINTKKCKNNVLWYGTSI